MKTTAPNMKTIFTKDPAGKKMLVTREFDAPVQLTWRAWTEKEMLDQWWAPKPWRAETKTMDFRPGGFWLYAMVSPEGQRHWSRADFQEVAAPKFFVAQDSFCDENGNIVENPPGMHWKVNFSEADGRTTVKVEINFKSEKDMQAIVEMGFEGGFTMCHANLDELLAKISGK